MHLDGIQTTQNPYLIGLSTARTQASRKNSSISDGLAHCFQRLCNKHTLMRRSRIQNVCLHQTQATFQYTPIKRALTHIKYNIRMNLLRNIDYQTTQLEHSKNMASSLEPEISQRKSIKSQVSLADSSAYRCCRRFSTT